MIDLRGLSTWKLVAMMRCAASTVCAAFAIAVLIFTLMLLDKTSKSANTSTAQVEAAPIAAQAETARPAATPKLPNTPLPPTATPSPDLLQPGTYIVGTDIQPGIYKGEAGNDLFASCYWARLKDLSGNQDAVIANRNSIGQFYIKVADGDYAFETACDLVLVRALPEPPTEFPQRIAPGTYVVGVDIRPGTYRGETGAEIADSCYWARLKDFRGELDSVIEHDDATGQYTVQGQPGDLALETGCDLERTGDSVDPILRA